MNYSMINAENNISVCGLAIELTESQQNNFRIIQNHWQKFNHKIQSQGLVKGNTGNDWQKYGITYKQDNTFFYMSAIPLNAEAVGFTSMVIPAGPYVQFQHIGKLDLLINTFDTIYNETLPTMNLTLAQDNIIVYEYYDRRFHWSKTNSVIDILFPIKK